MGVLTITGLVIGSGFVSGREVVVFFSRFGFWSLPCTILSFFIFWKFFKYLLEFSEKNKNFLKKSNFSSILNMILCFIFTSAMFAGVNNFVSFKSKFLNLMIIFTILFLCYLVFKKGMGTLNKINFLLVPVMITTLIVWIFFIIKFPNIKIDKLSLYPILYSFFYCMLNISNGSSLIIKIGEGISKKNKARVAFISALVLCSLIFLLNIVLIENPSSFSSDMPFLSLFSGGRKIVINIILVLSSLTSVFSLIYTSSMILRGLCLNEILIFLISVVLPFCLSGLGFGLIITYLYPLASALGVFMLGEIILQGKFMKTSSK